MSVLAPSGLAATSAVGFSARALGSGAIALGLGRRLKLRSVGG